MKHNNFTADFIVIGSGLGGLCVAAYLSRANYRVLVLEKNSEIGGKCTTRIVNGSRYVIGANGFGSHMAFILKDIGIEMEWISAPFKIHGKNGYLSFPLGFSSINELRAFGMDFFSILKMIYKLGKLLIRTPLADKTYCDYVDYFLNEPDARELLYLEAWYIGAHPDWLPASTLKFFLGTYYGFHKPIYPLQGAQAIPYALLEYVKAHGGEVLTEQDVTKIGIEKEKAQGVQVGNQWFSAKHGVISNAEIGQTYAMLRSNSKLNLGQDITSGSKTAFPFALLLINLDISKAPANLVNASNSLETNAPILIRPICEIIKEINEGQVNDYPVCNLVMSDLKAQVMNGAHLSHLPVHISILWPKSSPLVVNFNTLTQSILNEVNKRYPGFTESVLSSQWVTPDQYEKYFGFSSSSAPVLETPTYTKPSWKLPINGLYNVGTTVLPSGSHSGTAIESGRRCAADILADIRNNN